MKNTAKKIIGIIAAIIISLVFAANLNVGVAKAEDVIELYTYDDLILMASHPDGHFKLMADIDCSGKSWTPIDFSGFLEGNGHAILNLKVTQLGPTYDVTYDGNMVAYDTYFAGFFGCLRNGHVIDLKILGINIDIDTDKPVFAGGIAGFMDNGNISGCRVEGQVKVATSGHSFGVGGIAGFGRGGIDSTSADMTLIAIDKDVEYKEEQFMGGAYAAGYIDLRNNSIVIRGYDSDHGYVHDGGLVGMYIFYPEDLDYYGAMTGNSVSGFIKFYEDNDDRRAYCEAFIGEIMNWSFENDDSVNEDDFERQEIYYDEFYNEETDTYVTLLPHSCGAEDFDKNVVAPTETENGYTVYTCKNCGYSYKADYTVVLNNPHIEVPSEPETDKPVSPDKSKASKRTILIIIIVVIVVIIAALIVLFIISQNQKKKREKARRARMKARRERERREWLEQEDDEK